MKLSIVCPNCNEKITICIIDTEIISVEVDEENSLHDIYDLLKKYNIEFG